MHNQVHDHGHARLQPHDENAQRLTVESPQAHLLRWHYRLGHLSFNLIKEILVVGLMPKKLAEDLIPKYAGCMFAGMTNEPWHSKGKKADGQIG